jgi:hypothetical protein
VHLDAVREFDESVAVARKAGIKVIVFDKSLYPEMDDEKHPDGVFPNNWFSTEPTGEILLYPVSRHTRVLEKHALPYYLELLD